MAKKDKEPLIVQPSDGEQQLETSLVGNMPTKVRIKGTTKTYDIYWACNAQIEKLSRLLVKKAKYDNDDEAMAALHNAPTVDEEQEKHDAEALERQKAGREANASRTVAGKVATSVEDIVGDRKLASKAAAIYVLHGLFRLTFCYWWLWRWFYYVKQYSDEQLQPILDEGKKKVPLTAFFATTMSLTGARATLMMMTTKEAERTLQELASVQQSQQQKSDLG